MWPPKPSTMLASAKRAYEAGSRIAFFDALLFLAQTGGGGMPDWIAENLSEELVPLLKKLGNGSKGRASRAVIVMRDWERHSRRYNAIKRARADGMKGDEAYDVALVKLAKAGDNIALSTLKRSEKRMVDAIKEGTGDAAFWRPLSRELRDVSL